MNRLPDTRRQEQCVYSQAHLLWPGCPHRKLSNGNIQYFSYVLDAKLLTPCGMALTLASEMLTNEGNELFDKQDCELKAFPRLVEKLHSLFPRTPMCLLLDGLYANQNTIRLIEDRRWKYIATFKEGSMPERFPEAVTLAGMQNQNRLTVKHPKVTQRFAWAEALPVAEFTPNVLFCHEQPDAGDTTDYGWLTNFHLCRNNAENTARRLAESMRNHLSPRHLTMPGQIRFSLLADPQSPQPP